MIDDDQPIRRTRTRPARALAAGLALATAALMLTSGPLAVAKPSAPTYTNAVSKGFADTFADPSIIEGKDGWWYAYSTADPLRAGDEPGIMHIARTKDFLTWDYRGTVFDATNRPTWATADAGLWAPDVRYVGGQYVIYFTVTDTTLFDGDADSAIGVATAPTPVGPWTAADAPVVSPRPGNGSFFWTFDPSGFTDVDGQRYLYFGSYNGGVWVTRVAADGLTAVGEPRLVAVDNKFEGSYVVRHGRYYYLMASSANCCAGPATGYSVFAGRSTSPTGPFVDADGIDLAASKAGGTIVVTQNGNRWIGTGHHAIATDHAGRDFLVYHALDRNDAWLDEPFAITRRPMLLDRIDWVDGWPRVRAGAGPSDTGQAAPVTGSDLGLDPAAPAAGFTGSRTTVTDPQSGSALRVRGTARTVRDLRTTTARIRLDLRADEPLELRLGRADRQLQVSVDPDRSTLTVRTVRGGRTTSSSSPIRLDSGGWPTLVVEVDRDAVLAQLSEDDLGDPYAEVRLAARGIGASLAWAPLQLRSPDALVDNVSVRALAREATALVATPEVGPLLSADEFSTPLTDDWRWVREDTDATVGGGALRWPLPAADLTGDSNSAGVLLDEQTPDGTWIAETKLRLDLGVDTVRNFQQAGLIAYEDDDDFARLSSVAIWNTRQIEFGRERAAAPGADPVFGGAIVGTPDATVWLRLAHTRNAAGEHLYRAASSRDGSRWTWGAVWTFAADTDPEIGLVAHGGDDPAIAAEFDYLRFYRATWPGEPR